MPAPEEVPLDVAAVRHQLEAHRSAIEDRVGGLAKRPERGASQGFGKRIVYGTTEAVARLT